jgi:hypothetical protein
VNGDNVIPFRRRSLASGTPAPGRQRIRLGLAIALAAQPGAVSIVIGDTELWLDPAQARELGNDLTELADDADGGRRG